MCSLSLLPFLPLGRPLPAPTIVCQFTQTRNSSSFRELKNLTHTHTYKHTNSRLHYLHRIQTTVVVVDHPQPLVRLFVSSYKSRDASNVSEKQQLQQQVRMAKVIQSTHTIHKVHTIQTQIESTHKQNTQMHTHM